jgi:integrase
VIERRKRTRRDGKTYVVYRVRWEEAGAAGWTERNRTFHKRADAEAFEAQVITMKRTGDLATLDAGRETLADFAERWWEDYASPNLERATLVTYAAVWNKHALPRLGHYELRHLNPEVVARFRTELEGAGVGPSSIRKTLVVVQSVLQRAVEWRRIQTNPAAVVRKPPARRARAVRVVAPIAVEQLRRHLLDRGRLRDAVLVATLAYAGLRPQEALALTHGQVRGHTLLVEEAASHGQLKGQKTGRPPRTITLLPPLREDLAEWRSAARADGPDGLVFGDAAGAVWHKHDWDNWRADVFGPAARNCGLNAMVPYDLRHSFASLLLHEGRHSIVEIAAQLGHAPAMTLGTYAHVIAELAGSDRRVSAEQQIRRARAAVAVASSGPYPAHDGSRGAHQ